MQDLSDTVSLSKLRWHCRRGMRELDVLMLRFLDDHYIQANLEDQQGFVELLALEDPILFGYVIGREEPQDEKLQKLVVKIREGLRQPKS